MTQKRFYLIGGLVSLFLAGVISFYASSSPDGLEKVAEEIGFIDTDYGVKGIDNDRASVGIAGVIGVLVTGGVASVLFIRLARKK
jgi:cobalt/nickel transport protein